MTNASCHNCGRIVPDHFPLCDTCTATLTSDLLAVPSLIADMTVTLTRQARMSRGKTVGKSAETLLPYAADRNGNPRAFPLDAIVNAVGGWARSVADTLDVDLGDVLERRGLRQLAGNNRGGGRPDPAALTGEPLLPIELAAVWLACHHHDLRRYPYIDELYDEITDVVASARSAIDNQPGLVYKGPCSAVIEGGLCETDLYAERGEDWVRCRRCGAMHNVQILDDQALRNAEQMSFTVPDLVRVLAAYGEDVRANTIHVWANRRELRPRGWRTPDGQITDHWIRRSDQPVYRLGDVRVLIAQAERRQAATRNVGA
ncbi:hypothetical protein [Rhodococcus pyridinivorans]|uniref:Uncharacterized protein n=1 Tax=Rhodococcus pyridinivorans AK37 TaxID=1114960 RepID=H0JL62_9NOCA|nr:hypothetical protein [Rhodococcus pyridinivorans]EHK86397.1 hypothetical protein AK37_01577 [Rhodococcus pyridinivorans AK37]MCD2139512.1 hypothetical protein [Rhodococcus pyridinivorans]